VGGQQYTLAALPTERPSTHCIGDWWTSETVWTGMENLSTIGIQSLDCSGHASSYGEYAIMATTQNETQLKYQCA
jgi:hypothetical protein